MAFTEVAVPESNPHLLGDPCEGCSLERATVFCSVCKFSVCAICDKKDHRNHAKITHVHVALPLSTYDDVVSAPNTSSPVAPVVPTSTTSAVSPASTHAPVAVTENKAQPADAGTAKACDECTQERATVFCSVCKFSVCAICDQLWHRNGKKMTHVRVALQPSAYDSGPHAASSGDVDRQQAPPTPSTVATLVLGTASVSPATPAAAETQLLPTDRVGSDSVSSMPAPVNVTESNQLRDNPCDECTKELATMFCLDCKYSVCASCDKKHHHNAKKMTHFRVPWSPSNQAVGSSPTLAHPKSGPSPPPSHFGLLSHRGDKPARLIQAHEVTEYWEINSGNFGKVYRAVFEQQLVVVKVPKDAGKDAQLDEFNRMLMLKCNDNLLPLVGGIISTETHHVWLVFPYLEGGSLQDRMESDNTWGRTDVARTVAAAVDMLAGLTALHEQGYVHRDLAPRNVLLDANGRCVLCDFGLSKQMHMDFDDTEYHAPGNGYNLPIRWMAPETLQPGPTHMRFTFKADVFSLGVVLWQLLTGQAVPYPDIPANQNLAILTGINSGELDLRVSLPVAVEWSRVVAVVRECLDPDATRRPTAAQALARMHQTTGVMFDLGQRM